LPNIQPRGENLSPPEIDFDDLAILLQDQTLDHFADPEKPNGDRKKLNAVEESVDTERQARIAADDIVSHTAQKESENGRDQATDEGFAGESGDQAQSQNHQPEILRRPESKGIVRQHRSKNHQTDNAQSAADKRPDRGDSQSDPRPALLGHRMTIEGSNHGRGFSWDIHQNRGDGAAVLGAVIDPRQKDNGRRRSQTIRSRQQDGDGSGGADSGERPDNGPDQYAHHTDEKVHRGEGSLKAYQKGLECFHRLIPFSFSIEPSVKPEQQA
jgi:hypothetical protein